MGHKITPTGLRIGINQDWRSQWVARKHELAKWMEEDYNVRKVLMKKLHNAGISEIELKRQNNNVCVFIHSSRLGLILGQKGKNLEAISLLIKKTLKNRNYIVKIEVVEERNPAVNAQILAYEIAYKIANRENYRTVQQESIRNAQRLGVLGIKITIGGRLRGADIARGSTLSYGKLPLSTLRAKLNYGFAVSKTTYGQIGVKVWIYKKEKPKGFSQ